MTVPELVQSPKLDALLKDLKLLAVSLSKIKNKQTTSRNTPPRYLFLIHNGTERAILVQTGRLGTKALTNARLKRTQQGKQPVAPCLPSVAHDGRMKAPPLRLCHLSNAWPLSRARSAGACSWPCSWDFQHLQGSTTTWVSPSGLYTQGPLGLRPHPAAHHLRAGSGCTGACL